MGTSTLWTVWFADEVVVVVKQDTDEEMGDHSEDKIFCKMSFKATKGEGRNMVTDLVLQNNDCP